MTRLLRSAVFLVATVVPVGPAAAESDPRAVAIADRVMESLGGRDAWRATRYLRFDFAVEAEGKLVVSRAHTWDKWTGRYRLEGKTKEGEPSLVLMNVNTKQGSAWRNGVRLSGEEQKTSLESGYASWINDTYWLLMPFKMKDPGVVLAHDGESRGPDATWDKVALSFEDVGLTPKDRYWAYVNRSTGLVDRWDYVLKGGSDPPTTWNWSGWKRYGKILLAPERHNPEKKMRIFFPVLDVPDSLPESVFTSP